MKGRRTLKRMLSMLLVLVMVLGFMPGGLFGTSEALAAEADKETNESFVIDFKEFAKEASQQDWWDRLPAGKDANTKLVGCEGSNDPMTTDEKETYFYYTAEEEGKAVNSVYTIGVKNRGAAEMLDMVSGTFNYEVQTENKQATIGGQDVHYFYAQGLASEENPDIFIATMTCYMDSVKDSSVLVSLASVEGALEELPSEEAMLADAEGIFASFSINK